jgi:hypothetical protein
MSRGFAKNKFQAPNSQYSKFGAGAAVFCVTKEASQTYDVQQKQKMSTAGIEPAIS